MMKKVFGQQKIEIKWEKKMADKNRLTWFKATADFTGRNTIKCKSVLENAVSQNKV